MMVAGYVSIRRSVQSALWPILVLLCSLVGSQSLYAADDAGSADRAPDFEYGSADRAPDSEDGSADRAPDSADGSAGRTPDSDDGSVDPASNSEYGSADTAPDSEDASIDSAPNSEYDAAAHTDEALLESGEQLPGTSIARSILREAQNKVLSPCLRLTLRNSDACRVGAAAFLNGLKAQGTTVEQWASTLAEPVRNNMYFYLIAPSFRLAKAIIKSRDSCGEMQVLAAGVGFSLEGLIRDAVKEVEVGNRTNLPESKELGSLRTFLKEKCGAGFD